MNKSELLQKINKVVGNGKKFGLEMFICLRTEEDTIIKKFLITEGLQTTLSNSIIKILEENYLSEGDEIESSINLADNKKVLYDFELSDEYNPFKYLDSWSEVREQFDGSFETTVSGFAFKLNYNDDYFWTYQQMYPMSIAKKSNNILAIIGKNNVYEVVDKNYINITPRIDLIIVDNHVITSNTTLMQTKFGYDVVIRNAAIDTIDYIVDIGLVSNPDKLMQFEGKQKLTNAKKLMQAKNSPVLCIEKEKLISRIQRHQRYKEMVAIVDGKIVTNTLKDVAAFVKLLNDDIVKSELSDIEYDSTSKKALEPIEY